MLIKEESEIDIFVASRIGSFKHIKYHTDTSKNNKKCIENLVEIKNLQKDDSITCMQWGNIEQTEILLGRKNQQLQVYDTIEGFKKTYTADFAPGHVVGLGRCKRKILAAVSSGVVKIWSKKHESVVETGGKLDRMTVCVDEPTIFGTGGEENDLKIWTIGESTPTFAAKNLANDWLQLRRPVWVADLVFLPGDAGRVAAVCSRHGYVRLYDSRAQRRPVCNVEFPNMAATCMTTSLDNRQVVVGFGRGQLHQVDLRKARPDKGYKGCAGAVASLAVAKGLLVSASLDRTLRVHDIHTKELLYKQYLTSKLSRVLIQTVSTTPLLNQPEQDIKEEEEVVPDPDDLDQIFEDMETVGEKPKKKQAEEPPAKKIKPSIEGSTIELEDDDIEETADQDSPEDAIVKLLRSTEKQKRRIEKKKKEKKAKSVFHNA